MPTLVMFALAALTTMALGFAPWYAQHAQRDAAAARIAATPASQRTLTAEVVVSLERDPAEVLRRFERTAEQAAGLRIEHHTVGVRSSGTVVVERARDADPTAREVDLAYRDELCANVVLDGRCPQSRGEVVLTDQLAGLLGVRIGDELSFTVGPAAVDVPLRVVGLYAPREPLAWYWSGTAGSAAYTTLDTVAESGGNPRARYHALVADAAYAQRQDVRGAIEQMQRATMQVASTATALSDRIAADDRAVARGVLIAALQLFAIGWLAIAVTARYAAEDRRFDIAQLALRGTRSWRVAVAVYGQSALPLLAGAACGAAVSRSPATGAAVALAVALAGLAGAVAADWRATRTPVERLLHAVPPRPPRLSVAVVDVSVLALAATSVYQSASTPEPVGVQLLAPALLALATAILVARLLLPVAVSAGREALARGRLTTGLGALLLARRAAAYRVVPLLAAGGCLLAVAGLDWAGAVQARHARSQLEVGADRVLTVASVDRERLLSAVRSADPSGHAAMAVVVSASATGEPVIALDSPRLAAVAASPLTIDSARLHPPAPPAITFTAPTLELSSTVPAQASGPVAVQATLVVSGTGERFTARFGPLPDTATAAVPRCQAGCRLVALELVAGDRVELHDLRAGGQSVLSAAQFADPARWRTALGDVVPTVSPEQRDGALTLATIPPARNGPPTDAKVYVVDAPAPLPVAVAGGLAEPEVHGTRLLNPFGDLGVEVDPIDAPVLPGIGGRGIIVDLEYAQRVAGSAPREEVQQVWLAEHAPADLVARLRSAGLSVLGEHSVSAADAQQARFGPAAALRFAVGAGLVDVVLAGLALAVVAAVHKRARDAELSALRQQGVPGAALRRAGRWAALAPAAIGVVVAVSTAAAARAFGRAPVPAFTDGWADPPTGAGTRAVALLVSGAVITLAFGVVAVLSGRRGRAT